MINLDKDKVKDGALKWWNTICPNSGSEEHKGERAELRRCHSTKDVMITPAYYRLLKKTSVDLENVDLDNRDLEQLHQLAAIAWILSWVDEDEKNADDIGKKAKFADILAESKDNGDKPIFSEIRFRRLLTSNDWDDLSVQVIRALKITKGRANVSDLIESIWFWNRGTTKERWAISYYRHIKDEKNN